MFCYKLLPTGKLHLLLLKCSLIILLQYCKFSSDEISTKLGALLTSFTSETKSSAMRFKSSLTVTEIGNFQRSVHNEGDIEPES